MSDILGHLTGRYASNNSASNKVFLETFLVSHYISQRQFDFFLSILYLFFFFGANIQSYRYLLGLSAIGWTLWLPHAVVSLHYLSYYFTFLWPQYSFFFLLLCNFRMMISFMIFISRQNCVSPCSINFFYDDVVDYTIILLYAILLYNMFLKMTF